MKEYIEREAVLKHLDECRGTPPEMCYSYPIFTALKCFVEDIPAANVVEVRHGRWKFGRGGCGTCSECGRTQSGVWDYDTWQNYCGHCGAKMDMEE